MVPPHVESIGMFPQRKRLELQTCVATFETIVDSKTVTMVLRHSQVHFGDETYFWNYNNPKFSSKYDRIYYKLITLDEFLDASLHLHSHHWSPAPIPPFKMIMT
mmetsp:Transcript_39057/g.47594  ORF Transcript_39057/g.47594 Transcript_39057/m.47594 type:complete len:104 (-) Transcript_39057:225-536(-)